MPAKTLAQLIYVVTGIVFLATGASAILLGTNLLPNVVRSHIVEIAGNNPRTLHIVQEFGSVLIFVGLITTWFVWHYEKSRFFHWAMTLFWALFALVHWFDTSGRFRFGTSEMIVTIPFVVYLLVGILRK